MAWTLPSYLFMWYTLSACANAACIFLLPRFICFVNTAEWWEVTDVSGSRRQVFSRCWVLEWCHPASVSSDIGGIETNVVTVTILPCYRQTGPKQMVHWPLWVENSEVLIWKVKADFLFKVFCQSRQWICVVKSSLWILLHLHCVATLLCEIFGTFLTDSGMFYCYILQPFWISRWSCLMY